MLASNPVCHPTCRNELRSESSTLSRTVKPGESDDVVETKQAEVRSIIVCRAEVLMSVSRAVISEFGGGNNQNCFNVSNEPCSNCASTVEITACSSSMTF